MNFGAFRREIPASLGDLQEEMNRMFDRFWHGGLSSGPFDGHSWAPVFDVADEADRVVVTAELPGLDVPDVHVSFQDDKLTLKGHKAGPWPEETSRRLHRHERRYGPFCRTIDLPEGVNSDGISASMRHGVITITLPKMPQNQGRAIRIDSAV